MVKKLVFLDNDSIGHQLASDLIAKFEWQEVEESKPFKGMSIDKW